MKPSRRRRGLSILEAVVAAGIFVAAMAMLGQLLDVGMRQVDIDRMQTVALLRCESTMEEIAAGIRPLESAEQSTPTPIPDPEDPRWQTVIFSEPTEVEALLRVTVVVEFREDPESAADGEPSYREALTRLVPDRSLLQAAAASAPGGEGSITVREMLGLGVPGGSP